MFLRDENLQLIDVEELKKELAEDQSKSDWNEKIDEHRLEQELAEMYLVAANITAADFYRSEKLAEFASTRALAFSPKLAGRNIFRGIKKIICEVLNEGSTFGEIVDAVLDALSNFFPGGIIIKKLVKKVIRFIINLGLGNYCGWN